mgnify:CR=1 FL=1|jgi:hypothetical protein
MTDEEQVELQQNVEAKAGFKEILSSIDDLNRKNLVSVYIPTFNESVMFKPLTVKQQKMILSSGVDMEVENLSFNNTLNDIILENCLSGKDSIKTIDKPLIVLQLRQQTIGDKLVVEEDDKKYTIDLKDHIDTVKSTIPDEVEQKFSVNVGPVTITGEVPCLKADTKYNKQFTKSVKKNKTGQQLNLTDVVGDIFVHEMVKYVKQIKIHDQIVDLDESLSVLQTIEVFENLPMSITSTLADKIKELREIEQKSLSNDSLPEDVQIGIDAGLFTSG